MKKAILIKSEEDFNKVKNLLGDKLHLDWVEIFLKEPTSIVIQDDKKSDFGVGSIDLAEYQKNNGFEILDTNSNIVEL